MKNLATAKLPMFLACWASTGFHDLVILFSDLPVTLLNYSQTRPNTAVQCFMYNIFPATILVVSLVFVEGVGTVVLFQ